VGATWIFQRPAIKAGQDKESEWGAQEEEEKLPSGERTPEAWGGRFGTLPGLNKGNRKMGKRLEKGEMFHGRALEEFLSFMGSQSRHAVLLERSARF